MHISKLLGWEAIQSRVIFASRWPHLVAQGHQKAQAAENIAKPWFYECHTQTWIQTDIFSHEPLVDVHSSVYVSILMYFYAEYDYFKGQEYL